MFMRGCTSAELALYNAYSDRHWDRNRLRQEYRYLRKHGINRMIARSIIWGCFSAGMESQWHLSFGQRSAGL